MIEVHVGIFTYSYLSNDILNTVDQIFMKFCRQVILGNTIFKFENKPNWLSDCEDILIMEAIN